MQQTGGAWTMASNRGPSAVNPPPNFQNDSSYYKSRDSGNNSFAWATQTSASPATTGVGGSWASASAPPHVTTSQPAYNATPSVSMTPTGPTVTSLGGGGTASSDGSYEKQMIMELCPPGGMTAVPPPDKLNHFARTVANLSPDLICPALLDCLEEGQPWIIRAKALCVIETCMKHGQKAGETVNAYTDFFHACSGEIAPLVQHNRAQIREPAKRVMALMGVVAPPTTGAPPPPVSPPAALAPPTPMPNLLDFDDEDPSPAESPAATSAATEMLFGGLTLAGSTPAAAPPPPPPPTTSTSTSDNLLGDFLSPVESAPTTAPAAPMGVGASTSADLFGDMMVKSVAAAPTPSVATALTSQSVVPATTSMFDNLSLKHQAAGGGDGLLTTALSADSSTMSTGSAFGFINQSSTTTATTTSTKPPPPAAPMVVAAASVAAPAPVPVPTRDAFDPLKNVTPNSQKKMMQVSPEQMQAMMYQQMMMQQQQYMMAMQQQQQRMTPLQLMNVMRQQQQQQQAQQAASGGRPVEDQKFSFVQDAMSMEKKK